MFKRKMIKKETPNILQYYYVADKSDPEYRKCTWARFYFDLNNYTLMIESDCGNFIHGWPITKSESFIELMARIEDGYLVDKISKLVFDSDKTIKKVLENVQEWNPDYYDEILHNFVDYGEFDIDNEDIFFEKLNNMFEDYYPYLSEYRNIPNSEFVCYKYPPEAETIVKIFCEYIQPILKGGA